MGLEAQKKVRAGVHPSALHDLEVRQSPVPLAEKERFELSNGFTRYTISSRAPSTKLGDFSMDKPLAHRQKLFYHKS